MGKAIILVSILAFPTTVYLTLRFSDLLGLLGVVAVLLAGLFLFLGGVYAGLLGVRTDELSAHIESLFQPGRRVGGGNFIKGVCPVDDKQVVFVHVSPHRVDARPDRLDLFLGACGHEVYREEIELEH